MSMTVGRIWVIVIIMSHHFLTTMMFRLGFGNSMREDQFFHFRGQLSIVQEPRLHEFSVLLFLWPFILFFINMDILCL